MRLLSLLNWVALTAPIIAFAIPTAQDKPIAKAFRPAPQPLTVNQKREGSVHHQARQCGDVAVTFHERVTTLWGESIQVAGSVEALGNWDISQSVSLSAEQYTEGDNLWNATVSLSPGTQIVYKYIRIGLDGSTNWEADPDHTYTVPTDCSTTVTISNTWQQTGSSTTTSASSTGPTSAPSSGCAHGPNARGCWSNGLSIDTDFDNDWPNTGRTVTYDLTITNTTVSPDGFTRQGFAVNGQFPGPTLYASWGDNIQITVHNELRNNGTSIHWHGMRMFRNNVEDGVPGVTECPIPPGGSKTYTIQATQYGTTWYHSHFSGQYGDGVWGSMVIYGPSTADYDEDLGPLPVSDWYYPGVYVVSSRAMHQNSLAPTADNGLINGTMVSNSGGAYAQTTLKAGKRHRLRLLNTGIDNHFAFSLDAHTMMVIAADFVPVVPYNASWIFVGIGQRYDVIITADQEARSYWFRAETQDTAGCGSNFQNGNIRSIFSYEGHENELPTTTPAPYSKRCTDETQLVPYWNSYIPRGEIVSNFEMLDTAINQSTAADGSLTVYWQVNGTPLRVDWSNPSLSSVRQGNPSWPSRAGAIELPRSGQWTYWVITEGIGSPFTVNIPHPIHLHGHDFYVLGWGTSAWTASDAAGLNFDNPMRRDVAMLPTNGWVAVAFETNNPGAWLMHCHIAWHADEGFAVQFIENRAEMLDTSPLPTSFDDQCAAWKEYFPNNAYYAQTDSGI